MSVNENDRVSTRRLKEFWQTAKTWIQNFVSGAIDTSEETMSSTMDTKIRAAKPDYTKPNVNGQIGDGFGYNDMVGNYYATNGYVNFTHFSNMFLVSTNRTFKGNPTIKKQIDYLQSLYGTSTDEKNAFANALLKAFEGKLVAIPAQMTQDENFSLEDFIANPENCKSTYIASEQCLLSPVWRIGENTYQTKLKKDGNNDRFTYTLSFNGNTFSTQTPTVGDGWAWCASFNNMPIDIGSCDVPDESITSAKIKDGQVQWRDLESGPYRGITAQSGYNYTYYENIDNTLTQVASQPLLLFFQPGDNTYSGCFSGVFTEGYYKYMSKETLDWRGNAQTIAPITNGKLTLHGVFSAGSIYKKTIKINNVYIPMHYYCHLIVKSANNAIHSFIGEITNVNATTIEITPLDSTFFDYYANDDDYLIIQSILYPARS